MLDVACDTLVWAEAPRVIAAADRPRPRRGRPPTKPLVVGQRRRVDEVVAALPASAWRRVAVGEGSQGPRLYEYAEVPVWFCEDELPGPPERLLVRRSLGQAAERKYHRGNAPASVPPEKLARVRGTRRAVEEDTQAGKGGGGLDEYQTRGWVGRHHHTALAMLAAAFLVLRKRRLGEREPQLTAPEVRALLSHLLDVRVWDIAGILKWSAWRRERNRRAAESRRKRRRAEQQPPRSKKKKPAL